MGRAKLNMEIIPKEKTRVATFKKRKLGLIKKMEELTILCDVSACMIIYGPKQETGSTEPEIWPQDPDHVRRIVDIYKSKNKDAGNKTYGLSDFFNDRKRKIEEELTKLRKKNMEAKYPSWPEFMNFMPEYNLRDFAARLADKAEHVRSRIDILRRNKQALMDIKFIDYYNNNINPHARLMAAAHEYDHHHHQSQLMKMEISNNQMHAPDNNIYYPTIDHHLHHHHQEFNPTMLLMDGGYNDLNNYQPQFFHEPVMAAWADSLDPSMICQGPGMLAQYYGPTVPVPVSGPSYVWENNVHFGDQIEGAGGSQYQMNLNNIGMYYE